MAPHLSGPPLRVAVRVILAVAAVWTAYAAVAVGLAWRDVSSGRAILSSAQEHAGPAEALDGRLAAKLGPAGRRFASASDRLRSPLLAPFRYLPVAGRQMRSLVDLSAAAARVTRIGADSTVEARRIVDQNEHAGPAGRVALVRGLGELAATVDHRLAGVALGPRQALVAPLADARNDFADHLARVREGMEKGAAGARAAADLLAGPRRYLVFAANNAEMRAGSGMFLSVGELVSADGHLRLGDLQTVNQVPVPPLAPPTDQDLAERWGWLSPEQDWRNLMLSPRFDVSAELAARMWVGAGHDPVDGVVALDPVALQGVLQATGPVEGDGRRIDADNVVDELLHDQYVRYPQAEQVSQRREGLGQIARATFDAVDSGAARVPDLVATMAGPTRGRHLLLWSSRESEEEGWRALGVDGGMGPRSLLVSIINRGGNKLDQFLRVTGNLTLTPSGRDTLATVRLGLENTVPTGEPVDIAGPYRGSGVGEGVYLGIVAVDLPGAARDGRFDGVDELAVAGSDGPSRVVGFETSVARGESRTIVARFTLPGRHGSLRIEPSARSPGIRWEAGRSRWSDGTARTVHW